MTTTRVSWYTAYISLQTIVFSEVDRFLRIWRQTLLPPAITMALYFLIFGTFIGSQISNIQGFRYVQYIVPGIVLMSMMTNAFANAAHSFFSTKFTRSIEELLISPTPNSVILLGYTTGGILRGMLVGIIVFLVSYCFTDVPLAHPIFTLTMGLFSCMVFSLGGFINSLYAKTFDDISILPTFILTPLTYLGGVFYSLSQLPPFWRFVSHFNPIFIMVDGFRYGMLGVSDFSPYGGMAFVFILLLLLYVWAYWLLKNGVGIKH